MECNALFQGNQADDFDENRKGYPRIAKSMGKESSVPLYRASSSAVNKRCKTNKSIEKEKKND